MEIQPIATVNADDLLTLGGCLTISRADYEQIVDLTQLDEKIEALATSFKVTLRDEATKRGWTR